MLWFDWQVLATGMRDIHASPVQGSYRSRLLPCILNIAREYSGAAIRKAIRRAGLGPDVTPHVIRHTVATRLLESGLNIQEVQHIMGHADQNTTARYLHASTQMSARRAADVLNNRTQKPRLELVT